MATSYTGTVTFTSSDSAAVLPPNTTIVPEDQGTLTFTATLETVGTQSITATDTTTSITGTESNISVELTVPKSLVITGFPATVTAGTAGNVTVTAYNADGTVTTGYTGTVDFSSTDEQRPAARRLHLHKCRRGNAYVFGHARDCGLAVDHRH